MYTTFPPSGATAAARTLTYADVNFVSNPACRGVRSQGARAAEVAVQKLTGTAREDYQQMAGLDYDPSRAGRWRCVRFSQFVTEARAGQVLTAAEAYQAMADGKKVYCQIGYGTPKSFEPDSDQGCALLARVGEFYPFARNKGAVDAR